MNKKEIIIGTTSINRPSLHINNIPKWYNWINSIDKNYYNITWFINIDWINKLGFTIEETQKNFKNIIKDIDIIFLNSETNTSNFLEACKRIGLNIEKYVNEKNFILSDVIIIWLEDDWQLNNDIISLDKIITSYLSNQTSINLSFIKYNYIHALAPSIISYELWLQIHLEAWKNQKTNIDPERCVGLFFIEKYYKYEYINNITIIGKKNIDENYFNQHFLNYDKSHYTFNIENLNNIINNRYINENDILNFCKNKITFIRLTPALCHDIGRNYMNNLNLFKNKNSTNNDDFYT